MARKTKGGRYWQMINIGARFRQRRVATWSSPASLSNQRVALGLSAGTANPYGEVRADHFVGVRTSTAWSRLSSGNYWKTGFRILQATPDGEFIKMSGSLTTMRVAPLEDSTASAWYLRLTRFDGPAVLVEAFLPSGGDSPSENEFVEQMYRARWTSSVGNHSTYAQYDITFPLDEASLGYLDSYNFYSSLPDHVAGRLRGIDLLSVRTVQLA